MFPLNIFTHVRRRDSKDSSFFRRLRPLFLERSQKKNGIVIDDALFGVAQEPLLGWQFFGSTIPKRRYRSALLSVILVTVLFTGRALHLQVVQGASYLKQAENNQYRTHVIVPPRGVIFDRQHRVIAANTPTFHLLLTAQDLPRNATERALVTKEVLSATGLSEEAWNALVKEAEEDPLEPHLIVSGIAYEEAMRLLTRSHLLSGLTLETTTERSYPLTSESLAHLIGYTGIISKEEFTRLKAEDYRRVDELGKTGIEKTMEKALRGVIGHTFVEVDATGKERGVVTKQDAIPGENLTLSIDVAFQSFIEQRLKEVMARTKTARGSVVAIDPRTGEVRALVSLPGFDHNRFSGRVEGSYYAELIQNKNQPLFNRAISGTFPSGSAFKPFVAYAALAEHLIDKDTTVISTGGLRVGEWYFPDWKAGGHGVVDVKTAIAWSVNTFFYTIGGGYQEQRGLGAEKITEYARQFGFGEKTGIALPTEADGFLPTPEWKWRTKGEEWYVGDSYHYAIGQGDLLVTPLQLASAIGQIANDGVRHTPTLIEGDVGEEHHLNHLDEQALRLVQEGMRQTVTSGSARLLSSLPFSSAGKTGTAQAPGGQENHAWYVGYAPFEDPRLSLTVLVEEGKEGSSAAVPLAKDIFSWWFTYGERES